MNITPPTPRCIYRMGTGQAPTLRGLRVSYADYDLNRVESIDLNTYDQRPMTVALADMVILIPESGTYTVLDTATAIEAEVTDISAGSLDDATSVATTDSDGVSPPDTLTLTVAEYGQLVDGDTTLTTPYRIVDTAANIQDAIADDGSSLGVIAGADSVESSDSNTLTFTVAEVKALNTGTVTIVGGYAVSDSGSNIALAFDNGDEGVLTGAVSVKTTSTATLTVAEFKSLLDAGNIDPTGGLYDIVDTVQVVDAGGINFSHAQIHKVYAQVDFFAAPEVVQDLTGLTNLATNADEIEVGPVQDVVLTVEQSDLAWVSSGSFRVVDTAAAIEAEVTDTSAGSLDDATSVVTTDGDGDTFPDTLTLTVAEHKQLDDDDTMITGTTYRIADTATNIESAAAESTTYQEYGTNSAYFDSGTIGAFKLGGVEGFFEFDLMVEEYARLPSPCSSTVTSWSRPPTSGQAASISGSSTSQKPRAP